MITKKWRQSQVGHQLAWNLTSTWSDGKMSVLMKDSGVEDAEPSVSGQHSM